MKYSFLLMMCLFYNSIFAQFPNWGWSPPIDVQVSGSTLNLSVVDPITQQTKTKTASGVDSYIYNNGVLAWISGGRTYYLVYDYNLSDWREDFQQANINLQVSEGIVAVQSATRTYAVIYDPINQDWRSEFWTANGALINNDGVVAVQSDTRTYAATYDGVGHSWDYDFWTADGAMLNIDGVVVVQSDTRTYYATYDPQTRDWDYDFWTADGSIACANGVVAAQSQTRTYAAAYDPQLREWRSDFWTAVGPLNITDGTVYFSQGGTNYKKGYDTSSNDWLDNQNTDLECRLYSSASSDDAPLITYLRQVSVGASSNSYNCGDGHQIVSRTPWKQFNNPGTFNITLTIYNNSLNSTCNSSITVTGTSVSVPGLSNLDFELFPNPSSEKTFLKFDVNQLSEISLELYSNSGQAIKSLGTYKISSGNQVVAVDLKDISSGLYFLRIADGSSTTIKPIVKE